MRKTEYMLQIEDEWGRSIESLLATRLYGAHARTYAEIGEEWSISGGTVASWTRSFGLNQKSIAFRAMGDPRFVKGLYSLNPQTAKELTRRETVSAG